MNTADTLRLAADTLENAATDEPSPGRWRLVERNGNYGYQVDLEAVIDDETAFDIASDLSHDDARYAALVDPPVGQALVAVLRAWACTVELAPNLGYPFDAPLVAAVDLARVILREDE